MNPKVFKHGESAGRVVPRPRTAMTQRQASASGRARFADAAYRLRYVLGPTISPETMERVRREHDAHADRLIAEGVSPRLLRLED